MNIPGHLKRYLAAFVALMLVPLACTESERVDLNNPLDPQAENYKPTAAGALRLTPASDTGMVINWTDESRGEDGFDVQRKIGVFGPFLEIGSTAANVTSYFDHLSLKTGVTYSYRVAPFAKNGQGTYSATSILLLFPAPSRPWVYALDAKTVIIQWIYSDFIQQTFIIEKSVNGGQFSVLAEPERQARTYVDTDVDTLNVYSYRIKAKSQYNESGYSPENHIEFDVVDAQILHSVNLGKPVHSISFSPDGSMFAAAGMSLALRVWRTSDGTLIRDFSYTGTDVSSPGWPFQVAFSPDGSLVATNANNAKVNVWRIQDGILVGGVPGGADARSMCFSSDGKWIFTGDLSGKVSAWNIANGSLIRAWQATPSDEVALLYVLRDGTRLISCGYGSPAPTYNGIQIWNLNDWSLSRTFTGFQSEYYSISRDEQYFTATPLACSLVNGTLIFSLAGYVDGPICLSFDNRSFLAKNQSGIIVIGQVSTGEVNTSKLISRPSDTYPAIACSPTSFIFAAAGGQTGSIDLWLMKREWVAYW